MVQTIALQGSLGNPVQRFQEGQQNELARQTSEFALQRSQELLPLERQNKLASALSERQQAQASRQEALTEQRERQQSQERDRLQRARRAMQTVRQAETPQERAVLAKRFEGVIQEADPNFRVEDLDANELSDQRLDLGITATDVMLGDRQGRILSGDSATQMGLSSGTVALETFDDEGNRNIEILQEPEGGTQRQRRVQQLQERGFSLQDAQDIAAGDVEIVPNQFGDTFLINLATGEKRLVSSGRGGQPEETQPTPQTGGEDISRIGLEEAVRQGTGPMSSIREFANAAIGPFIEGTISPETTEAKSRIRTFNQQLKEAFAVGDGRVSNYEQQVIQQLLPDPDSTFTDPDQQIQILRNLRNELKARRRQLQQTLDSDQITQQERGRLRNEMAGMRRALALMGDSESTDFSGMSDQQLLEVVNQSDEQLRSEFTSEQLNKLADVIDERGIGGE